MEREVHCPGRAKLEDGQGSHVLDRRRSQDEWVQREYELNVAVEPWETELLEADLAKEEVVSVLEAKAPSVERLLALATRMSAHVLDAVQYLPPSLATSESVGETMGLESGECAKLLPMVELGLECAPSLDRLELMMMLEWMMEEVLVEAEALKVESVDFDGPLLQRQRTGDGR